MNMMHVYVKRGIWISIGLVLVVGMVSALRPAPLLVEVAAVTRGTVHATVSGDARTRVKALYSLTAPVDGELERIVFEPGAQLIKDAVVGRIRPAAPRPL